LPQQEQLTSMTGPCGWHTTQCRASVTALEEQRSEKYRHADLAAWTRLLGHGDDPCLRNADPDTLRYRIWHLPARLARHARQRVLAISTDWPWKEAFLVCWQRLCAQPAPS
jgi:hypothetical protein